MTFQWGDECSNYEKGDLIIESDEGKYVIPAQCEGDIIVGSDKFGVVSDLPY